MTLSVAMSISLSGMQAQQNRAAATANNVANAMTPGYDRLQSKMTTVEGGGVIARVQPSGEAALPGSSNVDLAEEMLNLVEAEIGFKANASAWETGADMWEVLLSIKRD